MLKLIFETINRFGKSSRQYYSDENGDPSSDICMGKVIYNENMSRKELTYYNRIGEEAENNKGISKIIYEYDADGKFLGRKYLNVSNELK